MDDAFRVCSVECIGDLDGERQNQLGVHGTPGNAVLQRHAVEKLHGDEGVITASSDLVDGADIGMVESGSCPSLAPEAFQCLRVLRHIVGQEFESDKATKVGVLGLVNHTHPTAAEFLDDAVTRDGLANHGWHSTSGLTS